MTPYDFKQPSPYIIRTRALRTGPHPMARQPPIMRPPSPPSPALAHPFAFTPALEESLSSIECIPESLIASLDKAQSKPDSLDQRRVPVDLRSSRHSRSTQELTSVDGQHLATSWPSQQQHVHQYITGFRPPSASGALLNTSDSAGPVQYPVQNQNSLPVPAYLPSNHPQSQQWMPAPPADPSNSLNTVSVDGLPLRHMQHGALRESINAAVYQGFQPPPSNQPMLSSRPSAEFVPAEYAGSASSTSSPAASGLPTPAYPQPTPQHFTYVRTGRPSPKPEALVPVREYVLNPGTKPYSTEGRHSHATHSRRHTTESPNYTHAPPLPDGVGPHRKSSYGNLQAGARLTRKQMAEQGMQAASRGRASFETPAADPILPVSMPMSVPIPSGSSGSPAQLAFAMPPTKLPPNVRTSSSDSSLAAWNDTRPLPSGSGNNAQQGWWTPQDQVGMSSVNGTSVDAALSAVLPSGDNAPLMMQKGAGPQRMYRNPQVSSLTDGVNASYDGFDPSLMFGPPTLENEIPSFPYPTGQPAQGAQLMFNPAMQGTLPLSPPESSSPASCPSSSPAYLPTSNTNYTTPP